MRAWVVSRAGGPEVLELQDTPDPSPPDGWVHLDIKAFGLNRAEAVTRSGGSGAAVPFPRVIGIECVGTVIDAPRTDLVRGQPVAAVTGGMGRSFDGSYAEQAVVPRSNVFPVRTGLSWTDFAAIPETYLTAWGSLRAGHGLVSGARVVVRPGASALGLAVTRIVGHLGGEVIGITRSKHKADTMVEAGMVDVLVSDGPVAEAVRARWPAGATCVIDTVASDVTTADDLALVATDGMVCLAGSLAETYRTGETGLVGDVFRRENVTYYSSETVDAGTETEVLQTIVERVESGAYDPNIAEVVAFERLPEAHIKMDANAYCGKVVVTLD